ncbi:MAG: carbohydrate-binding domain-containing protein [Parabacteroides sp.]
MKRMILSLILFWTTLSSMAQTLHVQTGTVEYAFSAAQTGNMLFDNGSTLTIQGRTFAISEIDQIYVDDQVFPDNTVAITYDDTKASVVIAGNVAPYLDTTTEGAYVTITQSNDDTCGEIVYSLQGQSDNGGFSLSGNYKTTLVLQGVSLTSQLGAPLDIQIGKRIKLSVADGTTNSLADCTDGTHKGTIACKGHLELQGKGTLNIAGHTAHAIYAKEYITLQDCQVNILSAVKDGINCNQYFAMKSGELTLSNTGDDGIQVSYKDETDREAEDTGSIIISGGSITATITADAAKALKADGSVVVTGGTLDLTTGGGGVWDEEDAKTKASSCISADANVQIDGGTLLLTSTGCGGKGISCDEDLTINGGEITVQTSGGLLVYINGQLYTDFTGNTDYIESDYKSSPKGMKADGNVTINGGTIQVTALGNGGEGIESKAILTINDGNITVYSNDDGLNSSSHLYIKGGDLTIVATNNDGIDSNGDLYVSGGTIRSFGASGAEGGIDANEEEHYALYFTGGTLMAAGGRNTMPTTTTSSQPYLSLNTTFAAGDTIQVKSGEELLGSFIVPDNYGSLSPGDLPNGPAEGTPGDMPDVVPGDRPTGEQGDRPTGGPGGMPGNGTGNGPGGPGGNWGGSSSILITCPGLETGQTYTIICGSTSSEVTAQ